MYFISWGNAPLDKSSVNTTALCLEILILLACAIFFFFLWKQVKKRARVELMSSPSTGFPIDVEEVFVLLKCKLSHPSLWNIGTVNQEQPVVWHVVEKIQIAECEMHPLFGEADETPRSNAENTCTIMWHALFYNFLTTWRNWLQTPYAFCF